jgi:hypothetical protein
MNRQKFCVGCRGQDYFTLTAPMNWNYLMWHILILICLSQGTKLNMNRLLLVCSSSNLLFSFMLAVGTHTAVQRICSHPNKSDGNLTKLQFHWPGYGLVTIHEKHKFIFWQINNIIKSFHHTYIFAALSVQQNRKGDGIRTSCYVAQINHHSWARKLVSMPVTWR